LTTGSPKGPNQQSRRRRSRTAEAVGKPVDVLSLAGVNDRFAHRDPADMPSFVCTLRRIGNPVAGTKPGVWR
jgi:hypothetical protein